MFDPYGRNGAESAAELPPVSGGILAQGDVIAVEVRGGKRDTRGSEPRLDEIAFTVDTDGGMSPFCRHMIRVQTQVHLRAVVRLEPASSEAGGLW